MIPPKAVPVLKQALQLHQRGQLDQAFQLYAQVRAVAPRCIEAHQLAGEIALGKGNFPVALTLLTQAMRIDPSNTACSLRLGQALILAGRPDQAETVLSHAARSAPRNPELWSMLATALRRLGRLRDAVSACEHAIKAAPDRAEAHDQLGALLVDAAGHAAGEPHFRRATELAPADAGYWCNLGICIAYRKDLTGALPCFDKALGLDPKLAKAYAGRGLVHERLYRIPEAVADYRRAIALDPRAWDARSCLLLNLHYLPDVPATEVFAAHKAYGDELAASLLQPTSPKPPPYTPPQDSRRLRVGFFTPDFRAHSVAYFMEPLLRHLDRERFELFLYHDHAGVDWMTERLRPLASTWRHTAGLPHDTVGDLVKSDKLDLLFDLAGHTGFNRLHLLGRRLAPVQATYMGYPDTTGLRTMDYRLTDVHADPEGLADPFATERLLRFSPSAWCYSPSPKAPEVAPPPSLRQESPITFGCFNNFTKITDPLLSAWGRLLSSLPGSRLLIKNHGLEDPAMRAEVHTRFSRLGLDPARVDLLGRTERMEDHLATYARVDVALDTFPYHGTTTTCEALWMGVPVITLAGDKHCSRVGCSILTNLGHPEWIARDWEGYQAAALALAQDRALLATLRTQLRPALAASILCDAQAQAARFGDAIVEMVTRGPREA